MTDTWGPWEEGASAVFADQGEDVAFQRWNRRYGNHESTSGCGRLEPISEIEASGLLIGTLQDGRVIDEHVVMTDISVPTRTYGHFAYVASRQFVMLMSDHEIELLHLEGYTMSRRLQVDLPKDEHGPKVQYAFPSRDGAWIALVGHDAEGTAVWFLDPFTGEIEHQVMYPVFVSSDPVDYTQHAWLDDGRFGLRGASTAAGSSLEQSWAAVPGAAPEQVDTLPCILATPSSSTRDGLLLDYADGELRAVAMTHEICGGMR